MNYNNNKGLIDAVESYIKGEMNPEERLRFEDLRKSNTEVDQAVIEHTAFLQKWNWFNQRKKFQDTLNEIHNDLSREGKLHTRKSGKAKVLYLFNRYKKTAVIAASIAGITALVVSGIIESVRTKAPNNRFEILKNDINTLAQKSEIQGREILNLKLSGIKEGDQSGLKTPEIPYTNSGTGFLIDNKGFLVTNSHVVEKAQNIAVQNNSGKEFLAKVIYNNPVADVAIIKIIDPDFKAPSITPYSFSKKTTADLAEPIFTLGYPREEIVYNEGYLSSKTGYHGDTMSFQIDMTANRGNSGSPILNSQGEILGILNGRQKDVEGFAFATQSRNIFNAIDELKQKEDPASDIIKLNMKSGLSGLRRPQQAKKIEHYVYMVKVN